MLDLNALRDYGKWIVQTAWDVYHSVIRVGGWDRVFPGPLPRWASRVCQYFNLTPMTLKLYDDDDSREYLEQAQKALPASARAKALPQQAASQRLTTSGPPIEGGHLPPMGNRRPLTP